MTKNPHHYVAIMAGGVGSRFWPASRETKPKQFLDVTGVGKTLLQLTFERFLPLIRTENIYIVTNECYRDLIKEQLPQISDNQILCEPSRNNTAPSVAYTAFKLHSLDPKASFVVAPSDHLILKESTFLDHIKLALDFVTQNNALVTLGIEPTRPDTGYGYINYEKDYAQHGHIYKVAKFCEKPNQNTAEEFLASGEFLWNAGIFIWNAANLIEAFRVHATDIYEIFAGGNHLYNTSREHAFIEAHYPDTRNVSIDYAIMETATNVYTIPADIGWSDLGTWASLHAELGKDDTYNVVLTDNFHLQNSSGNIIRTRSGKLVVLEDVNDFIIVDEDDVLMIYPRSKEQDIKKLTAQVREKFNGKFL